MTEPSAEATDTPVAEIDFQGRSMFVRHPSPEQLLVWRRVLKSLQALDSGEWTGEDLMRELEKGRKLVDSLLVSSQDVDWLDDQMLDNKVILTSVAQIIDLALSAFQKKAAESGNREQRRAAKKAPAKKATRRKA